MNFKASEHEFDSIFSDQHSIHSNQHGNIYKTMLVKGFRCYKGTVMVTNVDSLNARQLYNSAGSAVDKVIN